MGRRKRNKYIFAPESERRNRKGRGLRRTLLIFLVLIVGLLGVSNFIVSNRVRLEKLPLTVLNLPEDLEQYSILHLSDLHGASLGEHQAAFQAAMGTTRYSCVVMTGDMLGEDGDVQPLLELGVYHKVIVASATEPVAGRPLRSPQIQLVTTGVNDFDLVIDNDDFEIVRANKNETGVVTSYESSTDGKLNIAAGDDVYTYFYIVPKDGVTPSNPVAKVSLIYNDSVTGPQKVAFNYNTLPGYSDDSSEIWAYYFPADEYNITGKLKMYFQDYNNPLVPTAVQN